MATFDFDFVIIDWESGLFTVIRGMSEYTYEIEAESWLLSGTLASGVPYREIASETETTEEFEGFSTDDDFDFDFEL